MNDRRVNDLVRMALEVEEIEREAEGGPVLRLVGAERREPALQRAWWVGAGLAAAAAVALAMVLPSMSSTTIRTGGAEMRAAAGGVEEETGAHQGVGGMTVASLEDAPTVHAEFRPDIVRHVSLRAENPGREIQYPVCAPSGAGKGCIVVAIYRDDVGAPCVRIRPQACNDMTGQDLKCITMGQPCTPRPNRALLVALSGPQRLLPKTESEAVSLASCILGSPRDCGGEATCYEHAAASCVSPDVSVKIETVAYSR